VARSKGDEALRQRLATPSSRRRGILGWLDENAEAAAFIDLWADMKAKGESEWTQRQLLDALRADYGFPFAASADCNTIVRLKEYLRGRTEKARDSQ